jgi:hypothetical protein
MRQVFGVGWYRFSKTFPRRWTGYLGVVVIVGLLGGFAMASIAGARRTQASYPTFLASTNPSDLTLTVYGIGGDPGPSLVKTIRHLPGVKDVAALYSPAFAPLSPGGSPVLADLAQVTVVGSLGTMFYDQDRLTVIDGRRADPNRPDEIMLTPAAARLWDLHVGQSVPLGFKAPRFRVDARVTGIVDFNNEIVQDDIDRAFGFAVVTPALMRKAVAMAPSSALPAAYELQLEHGSGDVAAVEREIVGIIPRGYIYEFHVTSRVVTQVELAVKPESVALGAFGAIAALVCLVLGLQAVARQVGLEDEERRVMRSFGASPFVTIAGSLIGVMAAVLLGSLLAFALAVLVSPLAPLGPVRAVYPYNGIAFDWTVLGTGLGLLVLGLGAAATALAIRSAPHRAADVVRGRTRSSSIARGAEAAGLSVAGVVGVRLALEQGRGRSAVPVRSALIGTVLAVTLVVATLTFASGLGTLVSHPPLYGWNWSYTLSPTNDVPPKTLSVLERDRDVAAWSGADYTNVGIDGENVPVLLENPHPSVAPPVLSGHGLDADNQIVLGTATLAELDKHVGDTVELSLGTPRDGPFYVPPTPLVIVGTATFPAVGFSSTVADHTSMGTGALVSTGIKPTALGPGQSKDPNLLGPELVFVRLRANVSASAGLLDMERVARSADKLFAADPNGANNAVAVLGVQRPAQIVNYRSIGSTPVILAAGLALGAIVALALTLAASIRRRRRDLGLLKALGFVGRQLAAAVAWQATVISVIGAVVGIPLGIALGRELWTLFARGIDAVPDATVPVLAVVLVGIGALAFANLVAALPGRSAARTPTALALRAE